MCMNVRHVYILLFTFSAMFGKHTHPIVGLTLSLGLILIVFTILVLLFSKEHAWILLPITLSITCMGIVFGYFITYKKKRA